MHHSSHRRIGAALGALALTLGAATAQAALIGSTSLASFNTASSGLGSQVLVDFETAPPASLGFGGTTAVGAAPSVRNQPALWNPSGSGFLGVDDAGNLDQFSAGDTVTFTSSSALRAFGLYVVGGSDLQDGDFSLRVGTTVLANGPQAGALTDGAGSYAYFLGFVASDAADAFSSITLQSNGNAFFVFDVDDVRYTVAATTPVPEPSSAALLLAAAAAALASRRRRAAR
jgi:hypothetical protein